MDKLNQFLAARSRALDLAGLARDYLKAAEQATEAAENLGREAKIQVSAIREGLPNITGKITFPEGQMPPTRDLNTLPGVASAAEPSQQDAA